jgi:hypothetical protein
MDLRVWCEVCGEYAIAAGGEREVPVWIGIYATQEMRRDLRTRLGQRAGRYLRCVADNISAGQGGNEGDSRFEEQRKSSTSHRLLACNQV